MLLCAPLLLHRGSGRWDVRLLTVGRPLFTLVQPTITAPFLWIALFTGGGLVTTALITLGYAGLTLFAGSFQESTMMVLARGWMERATAVAVAGGYANLHMWLAYLGLPGWIPWGALVASAGPGVCV